MARDFDGLTQDLTKIEDLARLTIADEKGNPTLRFGYVFKLYFQHVYEMEVRKRLMLLVKDYGEVFQNEITHYMPYEGTRLRPTKDFDYVAYFQKHMRSIKPDERAGGFDAELYGFPDGVDEPTPYHIAVAARPAINLKRLGNEHNALGRLEAYFPADWPRGGDQADFVTLLHRWAEIGQPIHGSLGLGLIMEEGCARGPFMPLAYPFLKRFIGLEYPDLGLWATMSEDAKTPVIRSVNWLTLIDMRRVEAIGGKDELAAALDATCTLHPYAGGVVIQAGDKPKLGDSNRGETLPSYQAVSRAMKPLRFEEFGRWGIFEGLPSPLDDRQETLRWVRRFD